MTKFESLILRKRKAFTKKGRSIFAKALNEQVNQAIVLINHTHPDEVKDKLKVSIEPIQRAYEKYYAMSAEFAVLWRNKLMTLKADDPYYSIFQKDMINFARTKGKQRMMDVTDTTYNYLVRSVEKATVEASAMGFGIDKTRELIIKYVDEMNREITRTRANLIAQTEMVTASNEAAMQAGKSTGLETRKFWSTSGLSTVRDSHIAAQQESINKKGLAEDETFESCPGMLYPGDPNGAAEDVCNCHCSIIIDIV
jgi:hypothetical protein